MPKWKLYFLAFSPWCSASNKFIRINFLFKIISWPRLKTFSIADIFKFSKLCPGPLKCRPTTISPFFLTEALCFASLSFNFVQFFPHKVVCTCLLNKINYKQYFCCYNPNKHPGWLHFSMPTKSFWRGRGYVVSFYFGGKLFSFILVSSKCHHFSTNCNAKGAEKGWHWEEFNHGNCMIFIYSIQGIGMQ